MSNPRQIVISYTATVAFEIPDDFPIKPEEIQKVVEWKANDWTDGRMPFTTETMMHAAENAARWQFHEAIWHHYANRISETFGNANDHMTARDALIKRCTDKTRYLRTGHDLGIEVRSFEATVTCPGCGYETRSKAPSGQRWKHCVCGAQLPQD